MRIRVPVAALAAATIVAFVASPAAAEDFASAPAKAATSTARLLSAGTAESGVQIAGVEIALAPGAVTYWRSPGEAGSPPVFDFSRSVNVAAVEPAYPTPRHFEEEGSVVAGYDGKVIFPLRVTPRDPKAPVTLDLALDYAACGKICLPAKAHLTLALTAPGASPYTQALALAQASVPRKASAEETKKLLTLEKRGEKHWALRWRGRDKVADVFAEAVEPAFLESVKAGDGYELKLTSRDPVPAPATITVVTEKGAIEAAVRLE